MAKCATEMRSAPRSKGLTMARALTPAAFKAMISRFRLRIPRVIITPSNTDMETPWLKIMGSL